MSGFKTIRRDPVPVPRFSTHDMEALALEADRQELSRIQRGQNINDEPAKPLSRRYQAQKRSQGLPPIRNLTQTGAMLQSRGVIEPEDNSVTIGFTDAREQAKAEANERIEPMLGVSEDNERAVDQLASQIFDRNVKDLR